MTPQEAEIVKLARLLGAPPDRFGYLGQVPVADLRALRERVTGRLFDAHRGALEKMAAGSRLLPSPILARMAERSFGPLLSARIAGLVEPPRGIDIAKRLSPDFLADVAAELDPRRAAGIISGMPEPVVLAVAAELSRREDWITIARFLDHLPEPTIEASLEILPEDALPLIVPMLDNPSRVAYLSGLLPGGDFPGDLTG
ncbi:hypothetical protein ORV05_27835 [Amycolatopsis cynarae]|uniref:Magnesium transporter MgtE intracellular domain-containing protein n=1 Tax=Amycolatopsis cynarae TaxID=2995223 RepID=A0ABY7AYD5_9PSEU|nr:hypothetical protein [Amycolatopsis sp. HUAS 11-8]WAL64739.1 hypothetical protein ORV05_27835 [Amycolatopsis sp. HUAS 11-8]